MLISQIKTTMTTLSSPTPESSPKNGMRPADKGRELRSRSSYPSSFVASPSSKATSTTTNMGVQKELAYLPTIVVTAFQATFFHWTGVLLMVSLIFGGCCANVFALEAIIKDRPNSGPLITFTQFFLTALLMSPNFISLSAGFRSFFLDRRSIPLRSWFIYTAFFITVNLLNNCAFAYQISVPLHIILRSGGPVASIFIGYIYAGKRYSQGQTLAVVLLTFGVITSALADARAKGQSMHIEVDGGSNISSTFIGFAILALAMLLSAFQGIYADQLYETYGRNHWKEALFYSHTLSLPLFLPAFPHLLSQWRALNSSPSLSSQVTTMPAPSRASNPLLVSGDTPDPTESCAIPINPAVRAACQLLVILQDYEIFQPILTGISVQVFHLLLNALTQYWCIRGVHLLSAKSSSLTVTIVLNIRKLVSLLLSIHLFGNALSHGVLMGAIFVFVGGAMYGLEGARLRRAAPKTD
ncbi:UAA transporter family-domain-containing protein [Aspergillus aurantiobrunneus]